MSTNQLDMLLKKVGARIPDSVTPDTRIEIHPSEWLVLADELERLQKIESLARKISDDAYTSMDLVTLEELLE